jgi:hypothetical protein
VVMVMMMVPMRQIETRRDRRRLRR